MGATDNPRAVIEAQRDHWAATLYSNPEMYGPAPSEAGRYAAARFLSEGLTRVLELGAGQGRDTLWLLQAGYDVSALDYAAGALKDIAAKAGQDGRSRLHTTVHDVRQGLPFRSNSFDACYSHMLFTMALSSAELLGLAKEVHRVLVPGGLCIYTVRHIGDAHYGAGRDLGDGLYENGGFVVHFFDLPLVNRLALGFQIEEVFAFEEGDLPRRLWRVTMRRSIGAIASGSANG